MNTPNDWERQTLDRLHEIHDRLIAERTELDRDISRTLRSIDHERERDQKRARRADVSQSIEDLERIIPLRTVSERAA